MRKHGDVRAWVRNNAVTVMFVLLCIICIIYSGQSMSYVIYIWCVASIGAMK